ncbi:MAG: LTA synthase family protein [Oscillospiraceae bacterium]|nr:LTA synthase family protein [Oscillospiraceae bacterium]
MPSHLKPSPPPRHKVAREHIGTFFQTAKERAGAFLFILRGKWQSLRRWSRKQTWTLPHLALFPTVFVYEEILLRLFGSAGFFQSLIYPVLFGLAAGLAVAAVTSLFRARIGRALSIVLLLLIGLLFTVECLVQYSYQVYMTIGSITSGAGQVVGGFTSDLLRAIFFGLPKIFLFFLPALFYIFAGRRRIPARRYRPAFVGILLVAALLVQGAGILSATLGTQSSKYKDNFEFNTATQTFGLLTSLRLNASRSRSSTSFVLETAEAAETEDSAETAEETEETEEGYGLNIMITDFESYNIHTTDEEFLALNEYVSSLTASSKNEYTGLFEGKNLILICAEAFSDCVISEELTPTLYRLVHNGFYFSEYYQPTWGGSTSTGEFSFLLGLVPTNGIQSMLDTQDNRNYFTLGSQLQRLGYYSAAFHNGIYTTYSRNLTHENLGYDIFLAGGNGLEDITGSLYPDDIVMFETTLATYIDKQPFSIYYMTISGHCIYQSDYPQVSAYLERVQEVLGDRYKDTTLYYFCYQMVLEEALTSMIETLEEAGIADNTVICLTADHYPYGLENTATFGNTEDYVTDLYGYEYSNSWEKDHNTLIIWSECLENEYQDMVCEISTPTYSLDIVPTLSNLFGLEYDSRLLVGRDVFSDAEALVVWNSYSWATEQGKYDATTGTYYPNEGYTADEDYIARIKQIVSNKISFSESVIDKDYYRYLFG